MDTGGGDGRNRISDVIKGKKTTTSIGASFTSDFRDKEESNKYVHTCLFSSQQEVVMFILYIEFQGHDMVTMVSHLVSMSINL